MTLSYSQLPALRGFPEGPAEVAHHRTLRRLLALTAPNHVRSARSQEPTSAPRHPPNGRSGAGQRRLGLAPVNCM
jgi:hypothetical protein